MSVLNPHCCAKEPAYPLVDVSTNHVPVGGRNHRHVRPAVAVDIRRDGGVAGLLTASCIRPDELRERYS